MINLIVSDQFILLHVGYCEYLFRYIMPGTSENINNKCLRIPSGINSDKKQAANMNITIDDIILMYGLVCILD